MTRSVLTGGAWSSLNIVLPYLLTSIVSIVAARVLGPDEMGRQSFIAFVTLVATSVCAAGLPTALTRYAGDALGRGRDDALRGLVRAVWLVELPLSLAGMAVLLVVAGLGAEPQAAWVLAAVTVVSGALGAVPLAALSGALQWRSYSIAILSTNVVSTGLTLGALAAGWGITGIVAVRLFQTAVIGLWSAIALRDALARSTVTPQRSAELEHAMLRFAAGTSFTVVLTLIVYQRSEVFFLNHFSSDAEIAHYAIAASALVVLLAAPQALGVALAPALANLHGAGQTERIRAGYSRALRISMLGTMPVLGLAAVMGPPLLLLVYGEPYRDVQAVFLALLPSLLAVPLIATSNAVLTAHRRMRSPLLALAAAAAVDLLAAYALVPSYGALGAAAASVSALFVAAAFQVAAAVRVVHAVDLHAGYTARAVVTSAAATAAGLAVLALLPRVPGLLLAPLTFTLVLAGAARLIGVASAEDARWLEALAGRAHPRVARLVARVVHP